VSKDLASEFSLIGLVTFNGNFNSFPRIRIHICFIHLLKLVSAELITHNKIIKFLLRILVQLSFILLNHTEDQQRKKENLSPDRRTNFQPGPGPKPRPKPGPVLLLCTVQVHSIQKSVHKNVALIGNEMIKNLILFLCFRYKCATADYRFAQVLTLFNMC
jgi:hypothetical protein